MGINELTGLIINTSIKIQPATGPGCFEKVLTKRGLDIRRQVILPINYEDLHIQKRYKLDLLVENMLVVELKSLTNLPVVAYDQVRTYLNYWI